MTYLVTDACIACKHTDCVTVCPVDCFYEGEHTLVINPDECIDCGVCEPECPVEAIVPDSALDGEVLDFWMAFNTKYSDIWDVIEEQKDPLPDAQAMADVKDKVKQYYPEDL